MTSIIPSLGTAVAGATQPNTQPSVRESPAATNSAASIAVGSQAADRAAKRSDKDPKTRAPAAQKRVESTFGTNGINPRPSPEQNEEPPSSATHDGKLNVVA